MAVSWLAIDLQNRVLSFRASGDRMLELPMPASMFPEPMNLRRVELDVAAGQLARNTGPPRLFALREQEPGPGRVSPLLRTRAGSTTRSSADASFALAEQ